MPVTGLELGVATWLLLVGLGGLLAVDATGWPQAMVSRPIVAGTLGGALLGGAGAGFLAGALLELMSFRHPPYGAARYPDTGPAGLIAGAAYAAAGGEGLLPLLAAVLAGWLLGWVGARSVHLVRLLNGRLVGDPDVVAAQPRRIERRHRWALRLDAARGMVLTAALLVPVVLGVRLTAGVPPGGALGADWSLGMAALGLAAVAGAGARNLSPGRRGWPLLLAGGFVGLALWGAG